MNNEFQPNNNLDNIQPNNGNNQNIISPVEPTVAPVVEQNTAPVQTVPLQPSMPIPGTVQDTVASTVTPTTEPATEQPTVSQVVEEQPKVEQVAQPVQENTQEKKKSGGTLGLILALLLLVGAIGFIIILPDMTFMNKGKSTNNNNTTENTTKPTKPELNTDQLTSSEIVDSSKAATEEEFLGLYKNSIGKIIIYKVKDEQISPEIPAEERIMIKIVTNTSIYGSDGKLVDGKIETSLLEDTTKIYLSRDRKYIGVISTNKEYSNYKFDKDTTFTKDSLYEEVVGDIKLMNSKYNGSFTLEKNKIQMVQISADEIKVRYETETRKGSIYFEVQEDGTLKNISTGSAMTAKIVDNTLVIESSEEDNKILAGTYTKAKTLTQDEIINLFAE